VCNEWVRYYTRHAWERDIHAECVRRDRLLLVFAVKPFSVTIHHTFTFSLIISNPFYDRLFFFSRLLSTIGSQTGFPAHWLSVLVFFCNFTVWWRAADYAATLSCLAHTKLCIIILYCISDDGQYAFTMNGTHFNIHTDENLLHTALVDLFAIAGFLIFLIVVGGTNVVLYMP